MSLAQLDFILRKRSLFLGGQSGTGKSHLAQAILLLACQAGYRCLYTTAADMLRHLKSGLVDDTLDQKLKRYLKPDVLLIDEVGFDQLEQDETRHAGLFFKVVDGRYGKASSIFTTNLDFIQLGEYLGDPTITAALVDRLVHHAVITSIVDPSWRVHESNQPEYRLFLNHAPPRGRESPQTQIQRFLRWFTKHGVSGFDLAIAQRCPKGTMLAFLSPSVTGHQNLGVHQLKPLFPWLRAENARGADIYFRPSPTSSLLLFSLQHTLRKPLFEPILTAASRPPKPWRRRKSWKRSSEFTEKAFIRRRDKIG